MSNLKVVKKNKYKVIGTYVDDKGKKHRLTTGTKLYTKQGGLKQSAIKKLAEIKGISEFELTEQVKYNANANQRVGVNAILSSYSGSKVERFLGNFGMYLDDFVKELQLEGIDVDMSWVADENHWVVKGVYKIDGPLTLPDGRTVEFLWDYNEGAIWEITS